ncbi:MAG: alpha/beta fold hydrolase [Legionella sp.]|nr:MAG: alpha/beta fold hydrolase [Legionella sp.]
MNIHLHKYGQGSPLVFFHGWGFDSQIWHSLIPILETQYQVILVDLPGFGLSEMMEWQEFKTQLLALLPEQFTLIGWSLGGLFATRLAIEEPQRVNLLFNCCSSPCFVAKSSWPGVPLEVFQTFYRNLTSDLQATLNDFVSLQTNKKKVTLSHNAFPSFTALQSGLTILESWDLRNDLNTLGMPTHYLFGRLDPITPIKTMQAMTIDYPQFTYTVLQKSAHMPFLSEQQEFIRILRDSL